MRVFILLICLLLMTAVMAQAKIYEVEIDDGYAEILEKYSTTGDVKLDIKNREEKRAESLVEWNYIMASNIDKNDKTLEDKISFITEVEEKLKLKELEK